MKAALINILYRMDQWKLFWFYGILTAWFRCLRQQQLFIKLAQINSQYTGDWLVNTVEHLAAKEPQISLRSSKETERRERSLCGRIIYSKWIATLQCVCEI